MLIAIRIGDRHPGNADTALAESAHKFEVCRILATRVDVLLERLSWREFPITR
jgi:hypothetical protein